MQDFVPICRHDVNLILNMTAPYNPNINHSLSSLSGTPASRAMTVQAKLANAAPIRPAIKTDRAIAGVYASASTLLKNHTVEADDLEANTIEDDDAFAGVEADAEEALALEEGESRQRSRQATPQTTMCQMTFSIQRSILTL